MTERQRLSYQDDGAPPLETSDDAAAAAGTDEDSPSIVPPLQDDGEGLGRTTSLQAWRGVSLAADVRQGIVPPTAVPPPPRLDGSLSSRDIALGLDDVGGSQRRRDGGRRAATDGKHRRRCCASNRLLQHTRIQLWKNSISAKRHPGLTIMQMLSFALFVVFLYLLQEMGKSRLMAEELHPPIEKLGGIPRCKPFNGAPCTTILYSPAGHPEVDFIMTELANEQGLTMGEDVKAVATAGDGNWTQYWLDHANQTLAAVSFLDRPANIDWATACAGQTVSDSSDEYPAGNCALPDIIRYKVYYNDTTRYSRASRTYTPFYPLDVTREVQRSLDEAILTLRGRHAGYQNCEETVVNVGTSSEGNESFVVPVPLNEVYRGARLQCSPGNNCAYDSPDLEGEAAPAGSLATAHLDPTGEGPDDWYLLQGAQDESKVSFFVGRYDSPDNLGWGYKHLQLVAEFCRPDWRANLTVYTKAMPVVGDARVETMLAETVFLGFGVMFFYCGAVFNYFLLLLAIVREKEHRLRTAMLMMGLSRGSCWTSWLIYSMVINSFSAAFCIVAGYLCGFQYFHHSNPIIVFLTFWMFSLAMTSFSFFASAIVQTERVAVVIGFLLFVVGTFFQVIVGAGTVYFYEPDMDPIYRRVFYHYPPFNFAKIFVGIGFSIGEQSYMGMLGEDNSFYFSWEHLITGEFPLSDNLFFLVMNFLEYGFAAWYLDYIFTSDAGRPQPFYFPLLPSFWCPSKKKKTSPLGASRSFADLGEVLEQDMNPTHSSNTAPAIQVVGLEKVFRTGTCGVRSANDVHALKGFDLTVKQNRVFCLLGPNGAGKTTLLSLLTGLHQASDGDATVGGHSVLDEMDAIREMIGVCPQHDILWPDLTAREHLAMFADIKGTPPDVIPSFVDSKLEEILLQNVGDVPSGKFSGGMKRRLSIGISSIGDPDIIFMDEPTTGTDPGNRRMIWNLIEKVKQDRCIVLTTHAMDEADLLSDEIGIMLQGNLFCTGNALSLKNDYGLGFRLSVKPNTAREVDLITMIQEHLPDGGEGVPPGVPPVVVDGAPGDSRTFMVPKERSHEFMKVLEILEEQIERQPETALAADFSVSHSTLEEVFMSIVRSQRAQSSVATASTGYAESELAPSTSATSVQEERGFVSLEESKLRATRQAAPGANLVTNNSAAALAKRTGGSRSQVSALVLKNISFQKRQRCTNFCQIVIPAILLFVVVMIQMIVDSTFEAKSKWEVKRNDPKEVDVENLIPAMVRELELDQTEQYLNDIGQYCYSGQRNDVVELYCPTGNITDIVFASYGHPVGSCGNFEVTPGCHADSTEALIDSLCTGKKKCYVKAAEMTFGGWSPAQCKPKWDDDGPEDSLELRVQIACGGQVDPLGGESTGFGPADASLRAAIDLGVQNTEAGEELQQLVSVGVSELAVTAVGLLDALIYNDALTTEQIDVIDFGFVNVDTLFSAVGVDLNQQVGDALAAQMRALNQTIEINIANLLGRDNLTFSSSELLRAGAAPPQLNASQLEFLEQAGLATLAAGGALADIPIDVGSAVGLTDGTSVSVTSDEVGQALDAANITLGDLLGFGVGNASQVDLALEIIRGVNGTQFFFDIEGDQISTQLDITRQILGTLPVLFGGSYGDQFDADTISAQLIEQLDGAGISSAEVLIENSVESVIANFFQFGNTAPLTPPVMMWSTPKVFSVSPGTDATGGGVCRDVHGWLEQIDKEVAASKRHIYEALDGGEYNHRMSKDEFAESGGNLLTELPFAAFIFDPENNASTGSGGHFNYTIQVETEQVYMSWWLPVQLFYGLDPRNVLLNFVDSSIAYGLDGRTRIDTEIQAMDYMFNRARALAVADQLAYILFPFALTFLLPVFMNLIVYEKEAKLKELMKMSGMQMKYYWVVNYCYNYAMYCVVVIAFSISCWSVQIRLWTQTSFFILFTLLFLWGHALVSLSFLLSTLLDRDLTSSLAGYVIVVAGVLASLVFNATVFYRDEPPMLYMMYAPLAFYRAIFIMTTSCSRFACMTMDDLGAEMLRIYFYLILDTLLYWLGFSYLDKVLPSKYGVPEHPLYFLKPVLAWLNRHRTAPETEAQALNVVDDDEDRADDGHDHAVADPMAPNAASAAEKEMERRRGRTLPKDETEDSRQEREMMLRSRNPNEFAVQMLGLHHEYDRSVVANKAKARTALVDLFLSIGANESQALLGPNGAGKSTLISILTGLFQPTSGTADVCGLDIRTHMKDIHKIIGICPQFSILWDTLTCAEHLLFFARLKGVPADEQRAFVSRTLEQVGLGLAADRLAQNLSGGMKRRLSIAMALVGDPLFLVMDEPTTGLDPETREELWRTLLKIRENGPAILLATHAMDEAELLCGRVSILSRGTLKCVGNPHSLRERFCPNYTLNVNFAPGFDKDVVLELLPGCELVSEFEVSASFEVQAAEARRMSVIFKKMEGAVEMGRVANWGLVRAGLEGVFLDVVQDEIVSH